MKKSLLIILIVIFAVSLLTLFACTDTPATLMYDQPGTIIFEVKNSDIDPEDIDVRIKDYEDYEVDYDDDNVIISMPQMLRAVVTLSIDGYYPKTYVVSSNDYNMERTYEKKIEFDEIFTEVRIKVVTSAGYENLAFLIDGIALTEEPPYDNGYYSIFLPEGDMPLITVSGGIGYRNYHIQLTEDDIASGVCLKNAIISESDKALIVIEKGIYNISESIYYYDYEKFEVGNLIYFEVDKRDYVRATFYNQSNWQPDGFVEVTSEDMTLEDYFEFSHDDALYALYANVYVPGGNADWCLLAEKTGEDEYQPVGYSESSSLNDIYVNKSSEYTIFGMCSDGKVRSKDIDISDMTLTGYNSVDITIAFSDTVTCDSLDVEVIDVTGNQTDFTGLNIYSPTDWSYAYSLGTITGNTVSDINVGEPYDRFRLNSSELPMGYVYAGNSFNDLLEFYYNIAVEGLFKIYLSPEFDLDLTMNSSISLAGSRIEESGSYYFDSSNTVTITDFSFDGSYYVVYNGSWNSLSQYLKVTDIESDGMGGYTAEVNYYQ